MIITIDEELVISFSHHPFAFVFTLKQLFIVSLF